MYYVIAGEHSFSVGDFILGDEESYDIIGSEDFMTALSTIQPGEFIHGVVDQDMFDNVKQHYGF